ncbi:hypothetical protein ACWD4G_02715 [Streptomyces sp. NPDC002643]
MTHRGRKLAALVILLVVLGLVLNNINSRTRKAEREAAAKSQPAAQAARPLSPLYVPRPASMISGGYGQSLSKESSPQQVAQAFAGTYATYDPDGTTPDDFVAGLPRLAQSARATVRDQLPDDWERHLSGAGGGAVVASVSDPDPTTVQNGETEVTAVLDTQGESVDTLRMTLGLEEGDIGWEVVSVELSGE